MIPYVEGKEKEADEESILSYNYEKAKEIKWYDRILLNQPLKVILALLLMSILVPVLIYQFVFLKSMDIPPSDGLSFGSCLVPRAERVPCGAGEMTQSQCHSHCCYDLHQNVCFHRFPSRFSYLVPNGRNWSEETILTPRFPTVPFNSQRIVTTLRLSIDEVSPTHLSIQVYDANVTSLYGARIDNATYDYQVSSPELNIVVSTSQGTIFNTIRGPLIASDNIWEMVFKLTEETMYGLGELPLKAGTSKIIYSHVGGLSAIPLIFAKSNGSFHGLLVDVKTPSEIRVGDDNQISLRSLTKTGLKLHVFVGPEPKDIMRDVVSLIGKNNEWDYWMLGAHVCSEVSDDDEEALAHLTTFIANATRDGLPYESHCGTKPIVFNSNGTQDATTVEAGARAVRNAARRYVPHIAPYIRYIIENKTLDDNDIGSNVTDDESSTTDVSSNVTDDGSSTTDISSNVTDDGSNTTESELDATDVDSNIDCTNVVCEFEDSMLQSSSGLYLGLVNDYDVVYPDYGNISDDFLDRLWTYNTALDGIFLVNNWPIDQSEKAHHEAEEMLPYFNGNFEIAFNDTPQFNASWSQGEYYFYDHNEYGSKFVNAVEKKFNNTPIYSTSLWMSGNAAINRQNIQTSWTNLNRELIAAALGGISGHWLWSSPICGDTENFDSENQAHLCVKWYMAATYLPMIKIHTKNTPRDPMAFDVTQRNIMIEALNERLRLLPYINTVLQQGPLLRPMFYQYPNSELDDLSTQFNVGDYLLIAPNLQPSQSHVHVRMPPGIWFEFSSGLKIDAEENEVYTLTTTEADFITLICSRAIVVTQRDVRRTAELTRRNSPFSLTIAMESIRVATNINIIEFLHATGSLYMSPNMTINFEVNDKELHITSEGEDFDVFCGTSPVWASSVNEIKVYGLDDEQNNYDTHKHYTTNINLCDLVSGDIVFKLFD